MGILLLPLYTRYLSRSDYGVMELLDLVPNIAGMLVGLRLSQALFYYYHHARDEHERRQYVSTAFVSVALIGIVTGLAGLACAATISRIVFNSSGYSHYIRLTFVGFACSMPVDIGFCYLRVLDRARTFAVLALWRIAANVVLNVIFLTVCGMGVSAMLWSSVITTAWLATYFGWTVLSTTATMPSIHSFVRMARYSWPLAISASGEFLLHFGDRMFLRNSVSLADLGLYALAYKLGMVVPFITTPFFSYWNAQMVGIVSRPGGKHIYSRMATYLLLILSSVTVLLTAFAKPALRILAAPDFQGAATFIPWIALAYIIRGMGSYWCNTFLLERRSGLVATTTWAGCGSCLLAYAILIPGYGLWGAVLATLMGFAVLAAVALWKSQSIRPFRYEYGRWVKIVGCSSLSVAPVMFIHPTAFWSQVVQGIVSIVLFVVLLCLVSFATEGERRSISLALRQFYGR